MKAQTTFVYAAEYHAHEMTQANASTKVSAVEPALAGRG